MAAVAVPVQREVDDAAGAAAQACVRLGVPGAPARRLTAGSTSAVFDVPDATAVLSVLPVGTTPAAAAARLRAAAVLSDRLAFVHPHEGGSEPLVTAAGRVVLAWHREDVLASPVDWRGVGRSLRALHETPPAELGDPPPLRPTPEVVDDLLGRLAPSAVGPADRAVLRGVAHRLDDEVRVLGEPVVLVHGDPHGENVLSTGRGPVLCDTDEIGLAPAGWDLAFLVDPARPGRLDARERAAFEAGYGGPLPGVGPVRTWARSAHLRRTLQDLERAGTSVRDRWWVRARLDAWTRMLQDWDLDLQPVLGQSRGRHLVRLGRRVRVAARRSVPGVGVPDRGLDDRAVRPRTVQDREAEDR